MSLFRESERAFAQTVSDLAACNPFSRQRIVLERRALGDEFLENQSDWNTRHEYEGEHPNLKALIARLRTLTDRVRRRVENKEKARRDDFRLYEECVLFLLYHKYRKPLYGLIESPPENASKRIGFYRDFRKDVEFYFAFPRIPTRALEEAPHLFACFYQIRRAFYYIFTNIIGGSEAITRLRAGVWESIFTHNIRRYREVLHDRMEDFTSLITGPSGTGKELVARAIGLSRYLPFNTRTGAFDQPSTESFFPLNLSALSPTLIESELFGHRRGSFTGALTDRKGWLETCPPHGAVFLDEIGELSPDIQVKLLRVLQSRVFQRLGELEPRHFHGKIIAATNRDLAREMAEGRFRKDFYYRLCSDLITTPALHEQLTQAPEELEALIQFIVERIAGKQPNETLANEILRWIQSHLGPNYAWPGNFRELEQCIRNLLVHESYQPPDAAPADGPERLAQAIRQSRLTAEALLEHYCFLTYQKTGNYKTTAEILDLDQRTVKAKAESFLKKQRPPGRSREGVNFES